MKRLLHRRCWALGAARNVWRPENAAKAGSLHHRPPGQPTGTPLPPGPRGHHRSRRAESEPGPLWRPGEPRMQPLLNPRALSSQGQAEKHPPPVSLSSHLLILVSPFSQTQLEASQQGGGHAERWEPGGACTWGITFPSVFFFGPAQGTWKFPDQGSSLCHISIISPSSDSA